MEMKAAPLEVCCQPLLLKHGGELTTKQQDDLRVKYNVKCTTRPLRAGRAKELQEFPGQDTSEWRELTCYGDVDRIKAAHQKALELCEETRRARENETAEERKQRLEAKNNKISIMISTKEARKEENIRAHRERAMKEHREAQRRKAAEKNWASQAWWAWQAQGWPVQGFPASYTSAPGEWSGLQPLPSFPYEIPPVLESPAGGCVQPLPSESYEIPPGNVQLPYEITPALVDQPSPCPALPQIGAVPSSHTAMLEDNHANRCVVL